MRSYWCNRPLQTVSILQLVKVIFIDFKNSATVLEIEKILYSNREGNVQMKKLLNKKMRVLKNQKGLTLIELLVVIVILGIIAAIAIPVVMSNKDDAAKSTNLQNKSVLQDAVNRYKTMNDKAPASLNDLSATSSDHKGGPFLDNIPQPKGCKAESGGTAATAFSYNGDTVSIPAGCPGNGE
jgi:type IV pilus assembly protein PilA